MTTFKIILYLLAIVASLACTLLLFRAYAQRRLRLLLWSSLCFVGLSISNVLLFVDMVVFPIDRPSPGTPHSGARWVALLPLWLYLGSGVVIGGTTMIQFLAGAVTIAYFMAAIHFLRFWRKTSDRLFVSFASAFLFFALNQFIVSILWAADERNSYAYILRIIGFVLILFAIVDKNVFSARKRR